jgi:hypothetical protein
MIPFILRYSSAALLAATLAGCGTGNTTIDVDDHSVFIPSARVSVPLSKQQGAPSEPQNGHAIELGYTLARGSSPQSLSAGQAPIRFGGQTFNPPRELQYEFEYRQAEVHYRYRRFLAASPNLGFEALGGLVNSQLKFSASSPGLSASDKFSSGGLSGGVGAIWKFRPTTSLQTRYSLFAASETRGNRTELFAVQALGNNAALRGGYTWWYVRAEPIGSGSDVAVRFRGPAVSLDVMF